MGFYWPTLRDDAREFTAKCVACQLCSAQSHRPAAPMTNVEICWPFDQWGVDIVGPFPLAPGQRKFLIVAVEYFTKWVEAEPLTKITDAAIRSFLWKNIVCRFGVPRVLVSDNGTQFQSNKTNDWCQKLGIEQRFTSVGNPQSNGQTEVTNRTIVSHLRARLLGRQGDWADDLPAVLWAYRTTPRMPTGDTPYAMVYGSEAMLPLEVQEVTARVSAFDPDGNDELRKRELDLVDGRRQQAFVKMQNYRAQVAKRYNQGVYARNFQVGDLVLKRVEVSRHVGKLDPNWEGPFRVIKVAKNNAYRIADGKGKELPRPWNAINLRKFYS